MKVYMTEILTDGSTLEWVELEETDPGYTRYGSHAIVLRRNSAVIHEVYYLDYGEAEDLWGAICTVDERLRMDWSKALPSAPSEDE